MICQVTLMTNQECISPQVLVSVEIVSLESFAGQLLAQELHLEHLIVVKTDYVAIVRVGVGNRLNRTSDLFTGRARPCLVHTGILSLRSSIIEVRQALSVSENIDQFLQLLLSEVIVHLGCFKEILFSPRLLGQVSVVKGTHRVDLAIGSFTETMVSEFGQVVFLLHLLLPEASPGQDTKDKDVLDHLNIQLCAPEHVHEAKDANSNHQKVHSAQGDNQKAFLQ